jgi:hypothetical protein
LPRLADVDVAKLVLAAGWTGVPDRVTAIAVGLATGANPVAPNGVWGVPGGGTDASQQARAAKAVFDQGGWSQFPTYRSGRHVLYLPTAQVALTAAVAGVIGGQVSDQVSGVVDDATGAVKTVTQPWTDAQRILSYITTEQFWSRTAKFIIGGVLVGISALSLSYTTAGKPFRDFIFNTDRRIAEGAIIAEMGGRGRVINVGQPQTPRPARATPRVRNPRPTTAAAPRRRPRSTGVPYAGMNAGHRGFARSTNANHVPRHAAEE